MACDAGSALYQLWTSICFRHVILKWCNQASDISPLPTLHAWPFVVCRGKHLQSPCCVSVMTSMTYSVRHYFGLWTSRNNGVLLWQLNHRMRHRSRMRRGQKFQPKIWWNRLDNVTSRPYFLPDLESAGQQFVEVRRLSGTVHAYLLMLARSHGCF